MQILISVTNFEEAVLALGLGVNWLDLKDPRTGALGAAAEELQARVLEYVRRTTRSSDSKSPDESPVVSVACGELSEWISFPSRVLPGVQFAKLGLSGVTGAGNRSQWQQVWAAWAGQLPHRCSPVVVSYADWFEVDGVSVESAISFAAKNGVRHVLVDTFQKNSSDLFGFIKRWEQAGASDDNISSILVRTLATARRHGVRVVWAGKLTIEQAWHLKSLGAEVAGFRSAVCETGRESRVCPDKLRLALELVSDGGQPETFHEGVPAS